MALAPALLFSQSGSPLSFAEWAASNGAVYSSPAERQHRAVFYAANLARSSALDAADPLASFGPGLFADRSPAELAELAGLVDCDGPVIPPHTELQAVFSDRKIAAALARDPAGIDWVKRGAVTSAGDPNQPSTWVGQGRCGTCAQFSATGDIESQWFLAGNKLVDLAVQEMIDCSSYTGPYGMGWVSSVNHGIAQASTYPLANHSDPNITGCRAPCNTKEAASKFAKIDGATCLPEGIHDNETQMIAWLQHGPLSVSIAAGALGPYHGGIISGASCNNTAVDHAVLLVGFGEDKGVPYWKLKNSWGPKFGEDGGYFRMVRGYDKTIPGFNCLGLRGACQAYIGKPPGADAIPSTRW